MMRQYEFYCRVGRVHRDRPFLLMTTIMKFGGTSVADVAALKKRVYHRRILSDCAAVLLFPRCPGSPIRL
jgi:hypothetical protein